MKTFEEYIKTKKILKITPDKQRAESLNKECVRKINRLRKIDKLSYLLFASVYRDFDSLEDFQEELRRLDEGE